MGRPGGAGVQYRHQGGAGDGWVARRAKLGVCEGYRWESDRVSRQRSSQAGHPRGASPRLTAGMPPLDGRPWRQHALGLSPLEVVA